MASSKDLTIGTIVFAKMKGFSYWPGIITLPNEEMKKFPAASKPDHHCIFFFGSRNYFWIKTNKLKVYGDSKDDLMKSIKTLAFRKACCEVENFITKGYSIESLLSNDDFSKPVSVNRKRASSSKENRFFPLLNTKKFITGSYQTLPNTRCSTRKTERRISEVRDSDLFDEKLSSSLCKVQSFVTRKLSLYSVSAQEMHSLSSEPKLLTPPKAEQMQSENRMSHPYVTGFTLSSKPKPPQQKSEKITRTLIEKENICPSELNLGFVGLGLLGSGIVRNLLKTSHKVTVWNRTPEKCHPFIELGAKQSKTPADVIAESDITFCCVSDNAAVNELVFASDGILQEIRSGKSFVEMSGIDTQTSQKIADAVTTAGGRYLEVRFHGSKSEAEAGTLKLMVSGDRSLYEDCSSCFAVFSLEEHFFPKVGWASTHYINIRSVFASSLAALSEALSMTKSLNMTQEQILNFIETLEIFSPFVLNVCRRALEGNSDVEMSVKNLHKDLSMFIELADKLNQPCSMATSSNAHLKKCFRTGYKDSDIGAIICHPKPKDFNN